MVNKPLLKALFLMGGTLHGCRWTGHESSLVWVTHLHLKKDCLGKIYPLGNLTYQAGISPFSIGNLGGGNSNVVYFYSPLGEMIQFD